LFWIQIKMIWIWLVPRITHTFAFLRTIKKVVRELTLTL
jgi:hypothetical protein